MPEEEKSTLETIILAGVAAVTKTAETAGELLEDLVKKGSITVEQGKALNEELKHSIKEKVSDAKQSVQSSAVSGIVTKMDKLTPEERAKIRAKLDELEKECEDKGCEDKNIEGKDSEDTNED